MTDNGIGVPVAMQSRIFQIFTQVEDHRNQAAGGLGIGLALVRQIIRLHNGSIEVKSEGSGKGSIFSVRLPLTDEPEGLPVSDSDDVVVTPA